MIKPIEKVWVVVDSETKAQVFTKSGKTKQEVFNKFMKTMGIQKKDMLSTWKVLYKSGIRIKQVNINFTEV